MKTVVRIFAVLLAGLSAFLAEASMQQLTSWFYILPDGTDAYDTYKDLLAPASGTIFDANPDASVDFAATAPAPGLRVQYWIMSTDMNLSPLDVEESSLAKVLSRDSGTLSVSWNSNHYFGTSPVYVGVRFYYITNSVVFHAGADGATGSTASSGPQCYTNSYALTQNGFYRTGYTFQNWTNDAGVAYADGQTVSGSDFGVTNNMQVVNLYAVWTPNVYTVTFDANGGSTPTPSKSVTYDSAYGALPTPTWTGRTFQGWYTAASGGSRRDEDTKVAITSDETLYARWSVDPHLLATAVLGGGSVSPSSQSYDYGTVVDVTATPSTGWLFKGWQEDGSTENPRAVTLVSDVTLTAVFTQKVYSVTFRYRDAGGKRVSSDPQNVNYGENATAPSRDLYDSYPGHVFLQWDKSYENVTSTIVVDAEYASNEYRVEYNPNCDDYTGTMQSQIKPCGEEWNLRENKFARAGYTFGGWNVEPDGSGNPYGDKETVSDLSLIDGDTVTLYAQWVPVTYSIEFNGGTGSSGSMATTNVEYGAEVVLPANEFTKPGCAFQYWKCSELSFLDGATVSNLTTTAGATVTLVAMWDAPYWVAFDANGGAGEMAAQRFEADEAKALSANEFTRAGYAFDGWATNAEDAAALVVTYNDGAVVSNLTDKVETNTLFAVWSPISYVTAFDASAHSAAVIAPIDCIYDVEFPLPTVPYRDGDLWQFVGWSNTAANVAYYTNEVTTVSNLCTTAGATNKLVAVWKAMVGDLSDAMDIYNLKWENANPGFDQSWRVVESEGHGTGSCVAQTGKVSGRRYWAMTTSVTNSGTLTFWWKSTGTASLYYYDTQTGRPDQTNTFSATSDWTKVSIYVEFISDGGKTCTLRLRPSSDNTSDTDTIYIDQMTWIPDGMSEWTVAFNAMGGEGSLEPCNFPLDTAVSLPACTFTKDGYVFAGWSLKPNGGKQWADQESVSRDTAETVNVYAIWLKPGCYGIAFDPGVENGEWSMGYQSVAIGRVEKLNPCSLSVPDGKRFAGWRRKGDGRRYDDGVMVFNLADNPGDVVTLTAIWEDAP